MYAIGILYVIALVLIVLFIANKNNPDKQLARKTWLKVSVIFIIVATVNWLLIS